MSTGLSEEFSVWQKVFEVHADGFGQLGGCSEVDVDATGLDRRYLGLAYTGGVGDRRLAHVRG